MSTETMKFDDLRTLLRAAVMLLPGPHADVEDEDGTHKCLCSACIFRRTRSVIVAVANDVELTQMDASVSWEPSDLEAAAHTVKKLRERFLVDIEDEGGAVMAEPHFALAMAALEQATQHLKFASYHQAQALVGGRR